MDTNLALIISDSVQTVIRSTLSIKQSENWSITKRTLSHTLSETRSFTNFSRLKVQLERITGNSKIVCDGTVEALVESLAYKNDHELNNTSDEC